MRHRRFALAVAVTFTLLLLLSGQASAQEVIAGFDLLKTQPGQTYEDLSGLGAMCPGVQVVGNPIISLRGIPLEPGEAPPCAGTQDVGETDTFIQRLANTAGLNGGNPVSVPIEIVALHLQSVQPFTVNNGGGLEEWTLDVTLAPNQPVGNMQIRRLGPNGGTFNSSLFVQPHLTFTRVNPCPAVIMCENESQFIPFNSANVPWSYAPTAGTLQLPGCTTNFFPGISGSVSQNATEAVAGFSEMASLVAHGVIPPPPPPLKQLAWQAAVHFDFLLKNTGTGGIDDFHIKNPRYIPMSPRGAIGDSTIYIKSVSICDTLPFCPITPPTSWCRVDWKPSSPTYRRVGNWHFPPIPPGATAPPMDIVFSVPCAAAPFIGAWYEVTWVTTLNCAVVDSGLFRFRCTPQPCSDPPPGCRNRVLGVEEFRPTHGLELLQQNSPNPFSPQTSIEYQVPRTGQVALRVYDAQGRLVKRLVDGQLQAGLHSVVWDGRDDSGQGVKAGAYFYQIEIGGERQAKRMIVVR